MPDGVLLCSELNNCDMAESDVIGFESLVGRRGLGICFLRAVEIKNKLVWDVSRIKIIPTHKFYLFPC